MEFDAVIAGHIDGPAEVQRGMEHGQGFVLGHVDLIQNAETAGLGALINGPLAQGYCAVDKGVGAQKGGRIGIDVERDVPAGAAEHGGQIFGEHVFAGGLGTGQQQILSAQQSSEGFLPDLFSVVEVAGGRDPALQRVRYRKALAKARYVI